MNMLLVLMTLALSASSARGQSWEEQLDLLDVVIQSSTQVNQWKTACRRMGGSDCVCTEVIRQIKEIECWDGWNRTCKLTQDDLIIGKTMCVRKSRMMKWNDVGINEAKLITVERALSAMSIGDFTTQSIMLYKCLTSVGWVNGDVNLLNGTWIEENSCELTCKGGQTELDCAKPASDYVDIRSAIQSMSEPETTQFGNSTFPVRTCAGANIYKTVPVPPRRICTSQVSPTVSDKHYANITYYKMGSTGRTIVTCECYRQQWSRRCTVWFFGPQTREEGYEWVTPDKDSCRTQCNADYMASSAGSTVGSPPDYICVWTGGRSSSAYIQMTTFSVMIEDLMTGVITHTAAAGKLSVLPGSPVPPGFEFPLTRSGLGITMTSVNGTCIFVKGLTALCVVDLKYTPDTAAIRCPSLNTITTVKGRTAVRVCDSSKLFLTEQYNLIQIKSTDTIISNYFSAQIMDPRSTVELDKTVNNDLSQAHINWQADKEASDVNQVAQTAALADCVQWNTMHDLALSIAEIYPESAVRMLLRDDSITGYINGTHISYMPCTFKKGSVSMINKTGVYVRIEGDNQEYCLALPEVEIGRCVTAAPPFQVSINATHGMEVDERGFSRVVRLASGDIGNIHYGPQYIGSRPLFNTADMHDMATGGPLKELIVGLARREVALQNLSETVIIKEAKGPLELKVDSVDIGGAAAKAGSWLDNAMVSIFGGTFWGTIKTIVFISVVVVLIGLVCYIMFKILIMIKGAYDNREGARPTRRAANRGNRNRAYVESRA